MKEASVIFILLEIFLFVLAFIISLWPLVVCGIALAAWRGNWLVALCLAILADVLYGPPMSVLHGIAVPFTLGTLTLIVLWILLQRQMRRDMPDVL